MVLQYDFHAKYMKAFCAYVLYVLFICNNLLKFYKITNLRAHKTLFKVHFGNNKVNIGKIQI